ncbi:LamG-like jellyroll fold domain-containing protein [Neotabrizicola sp. sgz301269]|uniref:LamG-like jellyroll fold domain-containing protein n=1 Tax=Neotabrizicola sp. sgz301269 TaxID=3276282 RepID=UPI00377020DE
MATIRVTTQAELLSALKTATGGDTLLLADGDYGQITLKNTFGSPVTIKAENDQGASFTKISLSGASNLSFDGLHLDGGFNASNYTSNISLTNIDSDNLLYFRNVSNLAVDNVTAKGGQFSILLNSVQNFSVTNSTFGGVTEDVMRITGNSYNGLIENNVLADTVAVKPTHPDLIQIFGYDGYTPHDITIRGNLIYDDPATGETAAQGIFLAGAGPDGYSNMLIEDNLIYTGSSNTIFIGGGQENVVVQNNTLMSSSGDGGAIIRLSSFKGFDNSGTTVTGNIAKLILDETGASDISHNYVYGRNADLASLFHGADGMSWENFLPVAGSLIDFGSGYGATDRLADLVTSLRPPVIEAPQVPAVLVEEIDPVSVVLGLDGAHEFSGRKAGIQVLDQDSALGLDAGSISLSFNADTVSGNRGLFSKGAAGYDDDISAWISKGKLVVCVENDAGQQMRVTQGGIKANTDYDLLVTFGDDTVKVWLNGTLVKETAFDFDLTDNTEDLVIGGINGSSTRGTINKVGSFFDGTISNVAVFDHALTPSELSTYDALHHAADLQLVS